MIGGFGPNLKIDRARTWRVTSATVPQTNRAQTSISISTRRPPPDTGGRPFQFRQRTFPNARHRNPRQTLTETASRPRHTYKFLLLSANY
ncbi:Hypothetical protein NTJ_06409 [Nesidiocoris tenuis]|uniref:Uncharacterized protein n=1 Tax=Nesidiocoris tenuis TaxID=355587 RepID=A0ABN7ARQ4_9HEMI|nr:Hypothetical protein NTJ_06409 [Nesidiocoris tenuis]